MLLRRLGRLGRSAGVALCVWVALIAGGCGARSALDPLELSSTARGGSPTTVSSGGAGAAAGTEQRGAGGRGGTSNGGTSNGSTFNGPGGSVAVSAGNGGNGGLSGSANGGASLGGG